VSREGRSLVLVTGGARSGKSRFAQTRTETWPGRLLYIATAQPLDEEMTRRVEAHRAERGPRWDTCEEPLEPERALDRLPEYGGGLLDCLTLWANNLLARHGDDADGLERASTRFLEAIERCPGRLCVVTNEVGSGIVPANALARRFRDVAGRLNQEVAARADEAYLVVSGLPLRLR